MKKIILIILLSFITGCYKNDIIPPNIYLYRIEYIVGEQNTYRYEFSGSKDSKYELIKENNKNILIIWFDKNKSKQIIKTEKNIKIIKFVKLSNVTEAQ